MAEIQAMVAQHSATAHPEPRHRAVAGAGGGAAAAAVIKLSANRDQRGFGNF
jgi:spermidine synthase